MMYLDVQQNKQKIIIGKSTVYSILAVSFAASIGYWFILSNVDNSDDMSFFWKLILYIVIAIGAVTELVKKVSLSTFRNKKIWLASTLVSVITVLGCFQILDSSKQNNLVKQSDSYQDSRARQSGALDRASEYAWAMSFNISQLEAEKIQLVNDREDRKITYQDYLAKKRVIENNIIAKRKYDAAINTSKTVEVVDIGGINNSSNPLLHNVSNAININEDLVKTLFYLAVTILLEMAAFFIGGEVEKLERELRYTQAELLDYQNMQQFGFSMRQVQNEAFNNRVALEKQGAIPSNRQSSATSGNTSSVDAYEDKNGERHTYVTGDQAPHEAVNASERHTYVTGDRYATNAGVTPQNTVNMEKGEGEKVSDEFNKELEKIAERLRIIEAVEVGSIMNCAICGSEETKHIDTKKTCSNKCRAKLSRLSKNHDLA